MSFNHSQLNEGFLHRARNAIEAIRQARETYRVRIVEAEVAPGTTYWKALGVYHLLPQENLGNHHVYLDVLDEAGQRIQSPVVWAGWTWEGRRPEEPAPPIPLDKPLNEAAGNLAMFKGQNISIWIQGQAPNANDVSDRVENLSILHPDERSPEGILGNSIGHHSFYIVFQRARKGTPTTPPTPGEITTNKGVISGQIAYGWGYTVRLLQDNTVVAEQKVGDDLTFKFEGLPHGTYRLEATGPNLTQNNITLDAANLRRTINLRIA
jgi:hypothetical protein